MRRPAGIALTVLLVAAFAFPPAALAAGSVPRTNGSMVSSAPFFNDGLGRWEWNIQGSDGTRPAKGRLTLTIFDAPYPSAASVYAVQTGRVVEVERTSPNVIEFRLDDATTGPGDPFWADDRYRVIDNGRSGDELWQHCWRCSIGGADVWHMTSDTGSARVR